MDTIAVELMSIAVRNMGTEELEVVKVIVDQILVARQEELDECMREIDTFVGDGDTDGDCWDEIPHMQQVSAMREQAHSAFRVVCSEETHRKYHTASDGYPLMDDKRQPINKDCPHCQKFWL